MASSVGAGLVNHPDTGVATLVLVLVLVLVLMLMLMLRMMMMWGMRNSVTSCSM
jgi:hypothetical protein